MLVRDLTEVWISEYKKIDDHGEQNKIWTFKKQSTETKTAFLNIQDELNEEDEKTLGNVGYIIKKGITTMDYDIKKGNGISFSDISKSQAIIPEYIVTDVPKVGNTIIYKMEKYDGN